MGENFLAMTRENDKGCRYRRRVSYLYRVATEVRIQIPNSNRQPLRHLSGTQLGNEWARPRKLWSQAGYVLTQYVLRTHPKNPGATCDGWQRSKPHLLNETTIC